ncbi:MAG: thiamine-phosphate kinase [Bacillota bacterium]
MKLSEVGEFGLIERLSRQAAFYDPGVVVGIGDDAAVLRITPGRSLLATCDMMIEGVHFDRSFVGPRELGWKALASNLSDIAAMGGIPRYALISLGLPAVEVEYTEELYNGLGKLAREHGVNLVGGDTVSSPLAMVVDISVLGEVDPERLMLRSGARPGDLLLVTGHLGGSAAGLDLFLLGQGICTGEMATLVKARHLTPIPRVKEGQVLGATRMVTAMDDISDGLASEVNEIAQASGVGAVVWSESVPIDRATREVALMYGKDPLHYALNGGEDYELLFTVARDAADQVVQTVREATGIQVSIIGEILPAAEGVTISGSGGRRDPLRPGGFNHFRTQT